MNIRETTEEWERRYLSPYASLSADTRGRDQAEPLCDPPRVSAGSRPDPAQQGV